MYIESGESNTDVQYIAKRTDTNTQVHMGIGADGVNHGVYSDKLKKWLIHGDNTYTYFNGMADDHDTESTTATWIPVYNNNKIQHTKRRIMAGRTHSDYNNNQSYLATMSCFSFWNGAYNSNNKSNLTYAHQGTIQCKPTNLYNNSNGTSGTVTLSQSASDFTYLDIYYGKGNTAKHSVRVYTGHDMSNISLITGFRDSSLYQLQFPTIKINGTSITKVVSGGFNPAQGASGGFTGNEINIFRVDGWK